jgi:PAS domain S-box-containing protein
MRERAVVQPQESPARESSALIELKRRQLDLLPWAIAKVNRQGIFTFGNNTLHHLLGIDQIEGRMLDELFHGDDLVLVRQQLESRFISRASGQYQVEATRPADGVRIDLLCSAMPETNEWGDVIGSIALLRKLPFEEAAEDVIA